MGYTTDFEGRFTLNKKLSKKMKEFLIKFNETRRMARNPKKLAEMFGGKPSKYGVEGEFFVGGGGFAGQEHDASITSYNSPPSTQPSLWCQWRPTEDGMGIGWDGNEKFYEYVAWLHYIVDNFLAPKGYKLNGSVEWLGEDPNDRGRIVVKNNKIKVQRAKIVFEEGE
jgi:hypothetical protein